MNCKNCERLVEGNFCPFCGQSTKVNKINFFYFLNELSGSIFQVNKGFFYTLKELFIRPGHSIRDYLSGKRKQHFKPIAYALTLSTIYFILAQLLGSQTFLNDASEGFFNYESETGTSTSQLAIFNWFTKHYAYTILMLLPIYALASYLVFLGAGYNYLEHFVLNSYITGQQALLYSFISIGSFFTGKEDILALVMLVTSMAYAFWFFWQFFSKQGRITAVLRSILVYILSIIMISLVALIII